MSKWVSWGQCTNKIESNSLETFYWNWSIQNKSEIIFRNVFGAWTKNKEIQKVLVFIRRLGINQISIPHHGQMLSVLKCLYI